MTALGFFPSLLFVQVIALYPNRLRTQNLTICVAEEQLYCSNRERTNVTFVIPALGRVGKKGLLL